MKRWAEILTVAVGCAATVAVACERDALIGRNRLAIRDAAPPDSGLRPPDGGVQVLPDAAKTCVQSPCQGKTYACGDCIDNDGDGKIDGDDPDCYGPCQNAENTFFGSIPGQNHTSCEQDCYFDANSGTGNDACLWSHHCDELSVAPGFPPEGESCAYDPETRLPRKATCAGLAESQPTECLERCLPLTPNGCDCFGCCEIPGASTPVWLGSLDADGAPSCDLASVADPSKCHPCTINRACYNPCETCELCIGKREVPSSCDPGSTCPVPTCERGDPCGPCLSPCRTGQTCITGCCVDILR